MRKFTKEISALLASVAVGASLSAGTASSVDYAVSEGVAMNPDAVNEEEVFFDGVDMPEPTTVPLAGEPMPPDDYIEPTTEEFPPLGGVPMISDEYIETPVTTVMTTLPPFAGATVPTTTTTTTTTTTEEFPPLAGELAPADGDINGDGQFNIADVVSIQKYILNSSVAKLSNWYAADFNYDGKLDVFDVVEMRKKLIEQKQYDSTPVLLIRESKEIRTDKGPAYEYYDHVISADGFRYSMPTLQKPYDYLEDLVEDIQTSGSSEKYITEAEIINKISELTKNSGCYVGRSVIENVGGEVTGNTVMLSLLCKDEYGNMNEMFLYSYGTSYKCLASAEVRSLVKSLVENGYIEGKDFSKLYSDKKVLTEKDLIKLSEKGYDLTMEDLKDCYYDDIGSGLEILLYDSNIPNFSFTVSRSNNTILSAKLVSNMTGDAIDIRDGGVEEFIVKNSSTPSKNSIMTAKVVKTYDNSILVASVNDSNRLIQVYKKGIDSTIKVGDTVEIEYDGKIMETDPAQIRAYNVTLVESETRDLLNEYQLVRVGYASEYIPCDNSKELEIKTEKHLPIKACTSYAEFKELFLFIDDNFSTDYGFDGDNSFDEAIERYNDEFFDNNALLVAEVKAGSGSYIHAVKSVELNEDSGITVRISQKKPEVATCDMADWIFLISIPKDSVEGCSVDAVLLD